MISNRETTYKINNLIIPKVIKPLKVKMKIKQVIPINPKTRTKTNPNPTKNCKVQAT